MTTRRRRPQRAPPSEAAFSHQTCAGVQSLLVSGESHRPLCFPSPYLPIDAFCAVPAIADTQIFVIVFIQRLIGLIVLRNERSADVNLHML